MLDQTDGLIPLAQAVHVDLAHGLYRWTPASSMRLDGHGISLTPSRPSLGGVQ